MSSIAWAQCWPHNVSPHPLIFFFFLPFLSWTVISNPLPSISTFLVSVCVLCGGVLGVGFMVFKSLSLITRKKREREGEGKRGRRLKIHRKAMIMLPLIDTKNAGTTAVASANRSAKSVDSQGAQGITATLRCFRRGSDTEGNGENTFTSHTVGQTQHTHNKQHECVMFKSLYLKILGLSLAFSFTGVSVYLCPAQRCLPINT